MRLVTFTHTELKNYFEEQGCTLLSTEWKNYATKLDYVCSCGNISSIRLDSFERGSRCAVCGKLKQKLGLQKITPDLEAIKLTFLSHGNELVEFISFGKKLRYRCNCGTEETLTALRHTILLPRVCAWCRDQRRQESLRRNEQAVWAQQVKLRDGYVCVKGCISRRLEAHHIEAFAQNVDLRWELSNGVTFCYDCHKEFHKLFGIDTTRQDLAQFLTP